MRSSILKSNTSTESTSTPSTASAPVDIKTQAATALAALRQIGSDLPLDDSLSPSELTHARARNRVPVELLDIAATVLEGEPGRFPDFDPVHARSAVIYDQAMAPVVVEARTLVARIERSVMKHRSGAADQALALYAMLKSISRVPTNEKTRSHVKNMGAILTTNKKDRETSVTQAESRELTKVARAVKVAKVKSTKAAKAAVDAAAADAAAKVAAGVNGDGASHSAGSTPAPSPAAGSTPAPMAPAGAQAGG